MGALSWIKENVPGAEAVAEVASDAVDYGSEAIDTAGDYANAAIDYGAQVLNPGDSVNAVEASTANVDGGTCVEPYSHTPSMGDKAASMAWSAFTGIPGIGTAASGLKAIADMPAENASEEEKKEAYANVKSDLFGMIPGTSQVGLMYDVLTPSDTWSNFTTQLFGGKDAYAPTCD